MVYKIKGHSVRIVHDKVRVLINFTNNERKQSKFDFSYPVADGPSDYFKKALKALGFRHEIITNGSIAELAKDVSEGILNIDADYVLEFHDNGNVKRAEQKMDYNELFAKLESN